MGQPGTMSLRLIAVAAAAAVLLWALPVHAQVTGRQLLDWCQGALGTSVTATFDAFQCTAYLQAILDQQQSAGTAFAPCLGRAQPSAGDLMARIVPVLEQQGGEDPARLQRPATEIVATWIADHCGRPGAVASPLAPPAMPFAEPPPGVRNEPVCRRYYDNAYLPCATSPYRPCLRDGFPFLGQGRVNWSWIRSMADDPRVDFTAFRRLCERACGTNAAIPYDAFRAAVCQPGR